MPDLDRACKCQNSQKGRQKYLSPLVDVDELFSIEFVSQRSAKKPKENLRERLEKKGQPELGAGTGKFVDLVCVGKPLGCLPDGADWGCEPQEAKIRKLE